MNEFLTIAIVMFAIYHIVKLISEHLLKRKIIKTGHVDKAGILSKPEDFSSNTEPNKYPSLKWGLVVLFTGIGLIVSVLSSTYFEINFNQHYYSEMLRGGILLAFISMGFLLYFLIVMKSKK